MTLQHARCYNKIVIYFCTFPILCVAPLLCWPTLPHSERLAPSSGPELQGDFILRVMKRASLYFQRWLRLYDVKMFTYINFHWINIITRCKIGQHYTVSIFSSTSNYSYQYYTPCGRRFKQLVQTVSRKWWQEDRQYNSYGNLSAYSNSCTHKSLFLCHSLVDKGPASWLKVHFICMRQRFSSPFKFLSKTKHTKRCSSHLSSCQSHKVFHCLGNGFPKHPDDYSSNIFVANSHVKVHLKDKSRHTF